MPRTKTEDRFWVKVEKTDDCWLWTGTKMRGYGRFNDGTRHVGVHRYSYELHIGPIPAGCQVHHTCEEKACVNPAHLEAVTRAQHFERHSVSGIRGVTFIKDTGQWEGYAWNGERYRVGRFDTKEEAAAAVETAQTLVDNGIDFRLGRRHGQIHPRARFTEAEVLEIRRRYAAGGISQAKLAKEIGCSESAICSIISRRCWAHLPDPDLAYLEGEN